MSTRQILTSTAIAVCLICVAFAEQQQTSASKAIADEPQDAIKSSDGADETEKSASGKTKLQEFMRKKLDASSLILEGLCEQDAELVKKGAVELKEMSNVERWNILRDADYRKHTREFRENVSRVAEGADQGDFDKATLAWFDATRSCFKCHNHVRAERKAKN